MYNKLFSIMALFELILIIVIIASLWKVFTKAGQPGWAAIIPVYNLYILLKIICKPWWWLILYFIPLVNIFISTIVSIELAKRFNKKILFAIGLLLFPFIFYPILGFGDAKYHEC